MCMHFDAGVAFGLVGQREKADACFARHHELKHRYFERDRDEEWYTDEIDAERKAELQRAAALRRLLPEPERFRRAVEKLIHANRRALDLPERSIFEPTRET